MESTCSEDQQRDAVAYCICKFPLPALCPKHADKHRDSIGLHFILPLSARQVITSETEYMKARLSLIQLKENFDVLRLKFQQLESGEDHIEAAYQEVLRLAYEANRKLKQEFLEKKEAFRTELEQAITETRLHALDGYQPERVLAQLLLNNKSYEIVPIKLFTFQAECMQEQMPSVFHIALNFVPGLDHLNMGNCIPPTQHLVSKEDGVKTVFQQLGDAGSQHELQEANLKQQATESKLQTLETDYQGMQKQLQELKTENEVLKHALNEANERNSALEARLSGISTAVKSQEPVPDYSNPESRAALDKFGPYPDQDDEVFLARREPVVLEEGVYTGQWNRSNERHGYGKCGYKNGDIYEGQWRYGNRTGKGRFIWANGEVYIGEFAQNKIEGLGTKYFADHKVYSGAWLNGKRHGVGSHKFGESSEGFPNDQYFGEYSEDKINGRGVYFWGNGNMYMGSWISSKRHGKGVHLDPSGEVSKGEWKQGERISQTCITF